MLPPEHLASLTSIEAVDAAIAELQHLLPYLTGWLYPLKIQAELEQLYVHRMLLLSEAVEQARREREAELAARFYDALDLDGYILPGTALPEG